ncbi:hypothetical protein WBG78_20530 [Chryseolinea sp. T2]|uniref:hypothetical protein n=1 Tax=Chryseolinea sp. T2 TaxID=3129255 RepID=UPI003077F91A
MDLEVGRSYLVEIDGDDHPSIAVFLGDGKWKVSSVRVAYQTPVSRVVREISDSNKQRDVSELVPDYPDALQIEVKPK